MKIVISIGGSLLTRELTPENFKRYAHVVTRLWKNGHKVAVVCGGGKVCRDYRDIGKAAGAEWEVLDWIGVVATHLNASTFAASLAAEPALAGKVHWIRLKSERAAVAEFKRHFGKRMVVGAGYEPGHSTDYDSAIFAAAVKADLLVNASNIDGVYTSDPKKDPAARKLPALTYDEFIRILRKNEQVPGEYRLFDLGAAKTIKSAGIKTVLVDGRDPEEIVRAVAGTHNGSVVA
ncbi:MAG: UMP kinase [Candidatus Aenigmatarchaeota archaeon]